MHQLTPVGPVDPFAATLHHLRSDHGLSLRQLAARAHVTAGYIHQLEHSARCPSPGVAAALDRALGCDGRLASLLAVPGPGPVTPLGAGAVGDLHATVDHLVALDIAHGADRIHRLAADQHAQARQRLAVTRDPGREVRAAVAQLGQLAAWLAHDAGRDDRAQRLLLSALADAELAQAPIRMLVVDQLSMLAEWCGRPGDALSWADLAVDIAPRGIIAGLAHLRRARALAGFGASDAIGQMQRARGLIEAGPGADDPDWTWWINPAELRLHEASMLADLDRPAVDAAHEALAMLNPRQVRDRQVYTARLMQIQAKAGDWAGVEETAGTVRGVSRRVRGMVAGVRSPVRRPDR